MLSHKRTAFKLLFLFFFISPLVCLEFELKEDQCISLEIGAEGQKSDFLLDFEAGENSINSEVCAKPKACTPLTKKDKKAANTTTGPTNVNMKFGERIVKLAFKISNISNDSTCGRGSRLGLSRKAKKNLVDSLRDSNLTESKKIYATFDEETKRPAKLQFGDVSNKTKANYDFYNYSVDGEEKGWVIPLENIKCGLNTNGSDVLVVDSSPRKARFSWKQRHLTLLKEDVAELSKIFKTNFNVSCSSRANASDLISCEFEKTVLNVSVYYQAGLPNIFLTFDEKNEKFFELWPNEYINLKSCKAKNAKKKNKEPTYVCEIFISQSEKIKEAVIGTVFMSKFITVFDFEDKTIKIGESVEEEDMELGKKWRKANKEIIEEGLKQVLIVLVCIVFLICLGILLNIFVHKNYRRAYEAAVSRGSGRGTFKEKFKRSLEETHADSELRTEEDFESKN